MRQTFTSRSYQQIQNNSLENKGGISMLSYSSGISNFPEIAFREKKIKVGGVATDTDRQLDGGNPVLCAAYTAHLHEDVFYALHFWVGSDVNPEDAEFILRAGGRYSAPISDGGDWDVDTFTHYLVTFEVIDGQIRLVGDFEKLPDEPSTVFGKTRLNLAS